MKNFLNNSKQKALVIVGTLGLMVPGFASAIGSDIGQQALTDQGVINAITRVVSFLIAIGGIIAILYIIVGGFQYMFAGGSSEKAGEARTHIFNGLIGFAVIVGAYIIVNTAERLLQDFL